MRVLSSIASVALLTVALGCGQSQNLGGSGGPGSGAAGGAGGGTGASAASSSGGAPPEPCLERGCGAPCSTCETEPCPDIAEYCDANGDCSIGDPVCNEPVTCTYDGQTYPAGATFPSTDGCNTCDCLANGAVACTDLGCQTCGTIAGIVCEAGEFCNYPVGECNTPDAAGVCKPVPNGGCTKEYLPVCGCDGVTYANACMAAAASASILHHGPCPEDVCGGLSGKQCGADEYCHYPDGTCLVDDQTGGCESQPAACEHIVDPVCGCDGQTYDNPCDAASEGMSVDYFGACK